MKDSEYNKMFKVSGEKRVFFNAKTGETHKKYFEEKFKYDLRNDDIHDMEGNLIEEGKQIGYNSAFLIFFLRAKVLEVKEFLNYHYNYTPNKDTFLDYVEFGIVTYERVTQGIKLVISSWIKEKRLEQSEHKTILIESITQHFKTDLKKRAKEYLASVKNPLATELDFVEKEIENLNNAIVIAEEKNNKIFNGKVSIIENEKINLIRKLKVALKYKIELESKEIQPLSEPQPVKSLPLITDKNESKEPTLKQLALYHVYLGTDINKDNANNYLKNTPHTSGSKLKQEFDKYTNLYNRIYKGTDRDSFRKKLFNKVIIMLKKTNNKEAISKAENELILFEKNIA